MKINFDIKRKIEKILDRDKTSFEPNPVRLWSFALTTLFVGLILVSFAGFYIFNFFNSSEEIDTFNKNRKIDEDLLREVIQNFDEKEREFNSYIKESKDIIDPAE